MESAIRESDPFFPFLATQGRPLLSLLFRGGLSPNQQTKVWSLPHQKINPHPNFNWHGGSPSLAIFFTVISIDDCQLSI
jgi:hypothetical protein